jgi:hypothetical protein
MAIRFASDLDRQVRATLIARATRDLLTSYQGNAPG